MNSRSSIILTGFMASGKTVVGPSLARELECDFVDLDEDLVRQEKLSIAEIFDRFGECYFRKVESSALARVLGSPARRIIALGGGAWCVEQNRFLIREFGCFSVWLDTPFDICWARIEADKNGASLERPLAQNVQKALKIFSERRTVYRRAQFRVACGADSPPIIALQIAIEWRRRLMPLEALVTC